MENEELKKHEEELQRLEAEKDAEGKPEVPLVPFSLNHPGNGRTYPVMRKKHKGMKQVFVPETQLINSDVIKMYNHLVKQFNSMPQVVQSGFISELNRLINWIRKQQLEAEAIEKLKAESTSTPEANDNTGKTEEGVPTPDSTHIAAASDATLR